MKEIAVSANYWTFFTHREAPERAVRFSVNGVVQAEYWIRFAEKDGGFPAWLDVRRFRGMAVAVTVDPEMPVEFLQRDEPDLPGLYREALRPEVHYSVKSGWSNDPNGLVRLGDTYHMFYQYGPCGDWWNNMHWGHAVSKDLLHWQELPCALFPGERGMPFSGSALVDTGNRTGLGSATNPPVLFFYTATGTGFTLAHGGDKFTQCLAYSLDGCKTLLPYPGNPLIETEVSGNRDPAVIECSELDAFVMALYLEEDRFCLYRSRDLLHWMAFQTLKLPGDGECPSLYPLTAEDGKRKWIFSAAHDLYTVGTFQNGRFVPEQDPLPLSYGGLIYASQVFANQEPATRTTRISWEQTRIPAGRFSQQMGIPTDMRLLCHESGYRLAAWPARELGTLVCWERTIKDRALLAKEPLTLSIPEGPLDVELRFAACPTGRLELRVLGAVLTVDFDGGTARLGAIEAPLNGIGRTTALRMIVDRCTVEAFLEDGTVLLAEERRMGAMESQLVLRASAAMELAYGACRILRSVWPQGNNDGYPEAGAASQNKKEALV